MIRATLAAVAAGLLAVGGLAGPAHAVADTGTVTGTFTTTTGAPIEGATVSVYTRFTLPAGGTVTVNETQRQVGTVEGTYRTSEGEPVSNAFVSAYSTANRFLTNAKTGPDGRYSMYPVPAGPIKLEFNRHNLVQWAPQAPDFASAATFTVPVDETVVVDETQLPAGSIRGTVSAATGGPARDFGVTAREVTTNAVIYGEAFNDGRFLISVPAGQWRVGVDSDVAGGWYVPQTTFENATVFMIAAGQTVEVNETLRPLGAIQGTLRTGNGTAVREKTVSLWKDDKVVQSSYTDEEGGYFFNGLEPGDYLVSRSMGGGAQSYIPGTLHRDRAEPIGVRIGEMTTRNHQDPPYATLRGRLTTPDGVPVPGFWVEVATVPDGYQHGITTTDADGNWQMDYVYPEDYRVWFRNPARTMTQYAYGKSSADQAEVFSLRSGQTTTVDDTWRSGATLRVTAVDAATGEPVAGYCAKVVGQFAEYCTDGSEVTISGMTVGSAAITVVPARSSDYLPTDPVSVTVTDGQTATVTVPVTEGGRVNVQVAERATGTPAKDACVVLAVPGAGGLPRINGWNCTNKNGKVTTYAVPAGTYQMFVYPDINSQLGAQWVGADGGTGDQKTAVKINVKVGKTTKTSQVLLDLGGSVSGVVRDEAGAAVPGVGVTTTALPLGTAPPREQDVVTNAQGVYTLERMGPYPWPLLFTPPNGLPRQWSGGMANRFQAVTVPVRSGETTTYDATLSAGSKLTGTVTVAPGQPSFTGGRITAVNAATGDVMGAADFVGQGGTYEMPVVGGSAVQLRWTLTGGAAASGAWDDRVMVPKSGTKKVDLRIG